jgi:hypothetical protein
MMEVTTDMVELGKCISRCFMTPSIREIETE